MDKVETMGSVEAGVVFTFTETDPDGGGRLQIVGHSDSIKERMCDMFRGQESKAAKYLPLMQPGPFTVELEPKEMQHYGRAAWYAFPLALDDEWFAPYEKCLRRITGYTGAIGDFSVTPSASVLAYHYAGFRFEEGHIQATVYAKTHAWNGKSALEYGNELANRYLVECVAEVPPVPEFIQKGNGAYYRNPKYATGYKPRPVPSLKSEALWDALFSWWRTNHASARQREILDAVDSLEKRNPTGRAPYSVQWRSGVDFTLYVPDPKGTCDYDGKGFMVTIMKWEDFAKLA